MMNLQVSGTGYSKNMFVFICVSEKAIFQEEDIET